MPRLSLWPSSKCRECKGQPTPPPCYQCTFNLQNPPPKYTSLPSHVQQSWIPSRSPSLEESPPSYYLEGPEEHEDDLAVQRSFYGSADLDSFAIFGSPQASDTSVLTLSQSLGRIALAMVPPQPAWQLTDSPTPKRSRHRSSPGHFAATGTRDVFPRHSSGSLLASQLELSDRVRHPSSEHSSRSASPGPQHLLLTALTSRLSEGSDLQGLLNTPPLSPRSASPLPSQLLIPE